MTEAIPVTPHENYPAELQYALRVEGPGAPSRLSDGAYVCLVRLAGYPHDDALRALSNKLVHIERTRGDLIETSIRTLVCNGAGTQLWAADETGALVDPIDAGAAGVTIVGVAIGRYEPL